MHVAILLYERVTMLDAIGPYEVLVNLPGATVQFVAAEAWCAALRSPHRAHAGRWEA